MSVHVCGCMHECVCVAVPDLFSTNLCEFSPQTNVVDLGGFCPKVRGKVHEKACH